MDEDESYQRFLAECAEGCRCCERCHGTPCPGCTAGGVCDDMCWCDDDADDWYSDDDEWWDT